MTITKNHFLSTHHIMSMILQINELAIQLIKILLQILMQTFQNINKKPFIYI